MKRTLKLTSFLLVLVLTFSMFTACEINLEELLGQLGGDPGVIVKEMVTIQWVQGQKVLKEEVVEKGSKLTPWTPEAEGMEFQGWYERPYIKKFDFEKTTATKSMRIYAYFKSADGSDDGNGGEIDASIWYLIGAGKGDLGKCNNWNHEAAAKNVGMKLGEDGLYRVTLNLYAGDQFKMTRNLGWDEEKAIDIMAGYADGVVKDENGTVVFTAGENNNIVVAEGQDGKYEITYDEANNVMSFKFIEALESLPDDIRLIGDFNGWNTAYGEDDYKFTSEDNENWTFTWEVTSPATFKVYNNLSGVYYPGGMGNDLTIQAGTYTVHFNSKTREVVVKDENGNTVDVGFSNEGGNNGGGSTGVIPNANPVDKVYVVLNSTWNDGSLMSAWVWLNDGEGQWADFVPTEDPNVYEVNTAGFNKIVFVDFNADAADKNWDAKREQTGDLAIPDQSDDRIYYHVGAATWTNSSEAVEGGTSGGNGPALTETITVYFENNWLWTNVSCHYWGGEGFVGTEWPGQAMTVVGTLNGHDVYAIELPAGVTGFLFTGNKDTEPHDLDQSPDISTEGVVNGSAWHMDWADGNLVTSITYDPNGESGSGTPVVPDAPVVPAEGTTLYLVPGAWADGSLIGAWVWVTGGNGSWVSALDTDADGIYEVVVPTGCDNIIFVDFRSGATSMDWANKQTQTSDMKVPTDGNIYYHANAAMWKDNAEVEADAAAIYTVAGVAGLCGTAWDTGNTANDMEYDANTGIYTKVYTGLTAGSYEFKVVENHSWDVNWGDGGQNSQNNFKVEVATNGATLTITFDGTNVTYVVE